MAEALLVGIDDEEQVVVPSGGYNPGKIVLAPSGRPGVVQGQRPLDAGEVATLKTSLKHDVASASATVFAAGDLVDWDDTNKRAVAEGLGDFNIGTCSRAKDSGQLTVEVLLNESFATLQKVRIDNPIADPGNAGAIPVTRSGHVPIVTGGVETRTLAAPTFVGQQLLLCLKTDGGSCAVTVASTVNQAGNTTITFAEVNDAILLVGVSNGANVVWRTVFTDGAAVTI